MDDDGDGVDNGDEIHDVLPEAGIATGMSAPDQLGTEVPGHARLDQFVIPDAGNLGISFHSAKPCGGSALEMLGVEHVL